MGLISTGAIVGFFAGLLKSVIDYFKKSKLEDAYEEADEAKEGQAKSEAELAEIKAGQQAARDRDKGLKDLTNEEEY